MAMTSCPECKAPLSDLARSCPRCGCPITITVKPGKRVRAAITAVVLGVASLGLLAVSGELALLIAVAALVLVVVAAVRRNRLPLVIIGGILAVVALGISGLGAIKAVAAVRSEALSYRTKDHLLVAWKACESFHTAQGRWPTTLAEAVSAAGLPASAALHDQTGNASDLVYVRPAIKPNWNPVVVENPGVSGGRNVIVIFGNGSFARRSGDVAAKIWVRAQALSTRPTGATDADWQGLDGIF